MSSFSDFVKKNVDHKASENGAHSATLQLELANKTSDSLTALAVVNPGISKSEIATFGEKFSSLVFSDEFILELSNAIQRPLLGESEETFVERCKEALSALLDKHLNAKPK
jgi:hypothetical protein